MQVELRPRTFGENVGLIVSLALAHFWKLAVLQGALNLPVLAMDLLGQGLEISDDPTLAEALVVLGWLLATMLVTWLVTPLATGACIPIVASSFTGEPAPLGHCFATALRRFLPLVAYALLVGLLLGLGTILLVAPALIFATWYFVGSCAIVIEGQPALRAMDRSKRLSEGHRGTIFGIMAVLVLIGLALPGTIVGAVTVATGTDESTLGTVLTWGMTVLSGILWIVAPVVVYFDLRVKKEAFDVEALVDLVDEIGARAGARPAAG